MRKKLVGILVLLGLVLGGCRQQEKTLRIERVFENPDPDKYSHYYSDGEGAGEYTSLEANFQLDLEIWQLEFSDDLEEVGLLASYRLEPGQTILLEALYPEGIPRLKLKWQAPDLAGEYILQYNGRDGGEDPVEFSY